MKCGFDLDHYRELLAAAKTGGYRFALFDREPAAGDLLLRHDVDLSLDAALTEGERALVRLRELGHRVGLHAVHPQLDLDERFDPIVAWHNPDPEFMREPLEGAVNAMQAPYFDPDHYRSDSNQHWRSGCPHEELAAGRFEWLQLLTHPEIWAYPGATMRETMLAMLDAERERDLARLAEDRIDLT